ncbi:MAG TPA: DUF4258 domain-containing protein [Tepidisphaeraceae bacterium]|nr:DUF4258 domain-containing protein [Tepidisphaeraceae bacterium]
MSRLLDKIRLAVQDDRFIVSNHADDRLRERKIKLWQITSEIGNAQLLKERPKDQPNPSVEVMQTLPDGTEVKVIWAWNAHVGGAKLVTVHFKW